MDVTSYDLEREQIELLSRMVEADRRTPREERRPFWYHETMGGGNCEFLSHPGFVDAEGRTITVLRSDLLALAEAGFLRVHRATASSMSIDIRPIGYRFHTEVMANVANTAEQVAEAPRHYLDAEGFRRRYPEAHAKWAAARETLYADDVHGKLTRIGHDCTEAMQAFANVLVDAHHPPNADAEPGKYRQRLDAVIDLFKPKVGEKRSNLLHALVNYWFAASAIAERQEHGADKAGDPVTWEDARRVVFHTAIVMFEIDLALGSG